MVIGLDVGVNEIDLVSNILNAVVEHSYKASVEQAQNYLLEAEKVIPPGYEYLVDAVRTHLFWVKSCGSISERTVQDAFFNNLQNYLPGYIKINIPIIKSHIPDGFVQFNNEIYAVEVKLGSFDKSATRQLKRYISAYGCRGGIAVARSLKSPIPPNIKFVEIETLQTIHAPRTPPGEAAWRPGLRPTSALGAGAALPAVYDRQDSAGGVKGEGKEIRHDYKGAGRQNRGET